MKVKSVPQGWNSISPRLVVGDLGEVEWPRKYWRAPSRVDGRAKGGGRQEDRTPDLRVANAALSQLS